MANTPEFIFDFNKTAGNFDDFFMAVGYDENLATATPFGIENLKILKKLKTGIKYIRMHNIFTGSGGDLRGSVDAGCDPVTRTSTGELEFNWEKMDRVYDLLIKYGFTPYIEFGFMPDAFSRLRENRKNRWKSAPKDFKEWRILIRETVKHFKERYPENIKDFIFELWNEPNKFVGISGYFTGSTKEYCKLYDFTVAGLYDVFPEGHFTIGGPALSGHYFPFLKQFLKHCLWGKNHVTGEIGTKLDFVSFHLKGGAYFQTPNTKKIIKNLHRHMKLISKYKKNGTIAKKFGNEKYLPDNVEIQITELDPLVGCARGVESKPTLNFRNTEYYAAYLGFIATAFEYERNRKNYNISWVFSDNMHFADEANLLKIFNGCRSLTTAPFQASDLNQALQETRIIAKPMLKAFQILERMKGKTLTQISPKKYSNQNISALVTNEENKINILISNFNPKFDDFDEKNIRIHITNIDMKHTSAQIDHYILDQKNNNTYSVWKEMGASEDLSNEKYLKIKELEKLEKQNTKLTEITEENLILKLKLRPHSLNFYEIYLKQRINK